MKNNFRLLLLLLIGVAGCARSSSKNIAVDKKNYTQDENLILANFAKQEACWNKHDIVCYMEAYAVGEDIQTISRAGITHGYDAIISNYRKYYPTDKMGKLHFDMLTLKKLSKKLYFVTGRYNLKFDNRDDLAQGWFSGVVKKIDGGWYFITDHS